MTPSTNTKRACAWSLMLLAVSVSGCWREGDEDPTCETADRVGQPVVSACTRLVVLENHGGGFRPSPPDGSDCMGEASYALDLQTGDLDYTVCDISFTDLPSPWKKRSGNLTLDAEQLAQAAAALAMMKMTSEDEACGADKSLLTITVHNSDQAATYTDNFYSCSDIPGRFVSDIDAPFNVLRPIVQPE